MRMKKISLFMVSVFLITSISGLLTSCVKPQSPEEKIAEAKIKYDTMRTITFGSYKGEEIEWIVLESGDNGRLLLSKYAIDYRPYECSDEFMKSWETAVLRTWLNEEFFEEAFSEEEKSKILWNETEVYDTRKRGYFSAETVTGKTQLERIFLLSWDEVEKYYGKTLPTCYCEPTSYAVSLGAEQTDVLWWMRGPCERIDDAKGTNTAIPAVKGNTEPDAHNYVLYHEEEGVKCGIRPAMRVDLNGTAKNTIQPTDPIASVSAETTVTDDGLYQYTIYPGTDYEQTFTMNVDIGHYIHNGCFDMPRLCKDLGWYLYDKDGMQTYNTNQYISEAARVDNGIEMQINTNTISPPTHQLCSLSIFFAKPHNAGTSIFDSEEYYDNKDNAGNFELYEADVHFGEHDIEYVVEGFGVLGSGDPEYGFSYSDIVVVTYVLSFYSDSNNAGKNPFYYTAMDGWEGSGCTMFYDLP